MLLNIETKITNKILTLKDTTNLGAPGYLNPGDSESVELNLFELKNITAIAVVEYYSLEDKKRILSQPIFIEENKQEEIDLMKINKDGLYRIHYIVLPKKSAITLDNNPDDAPFYCIENNCIYYVDNSNLDCPIENKTLEEILEVNPVGTTISIVTLEEFLLQNLIDCYINYCKKIFNLRAFTKCAPKGSVDLNLIYRRDLVWMAINIIKYLLELDLIEEAERIIILIHGCNGVCKEEDISNELIGCGCGCC